MAHLLHKYTSCCHDGGKSYTIAISTFSFLYTCLNFPSPCSCSKFMHMLYICSCIAGYHEEYKYCTLKQHNHCLCHLELAILQQSKLLSGLGTVHRPTICNESYRPRQGNGTMPIALHCALHLLHWDTACTYSLTDPFLSMKWVWLQGFF